MDLTLNIDRKVMENVEVYAKYSQKSVSQLVEDYLRSIPLKGEIADTKSLGPITKQLAGIIKSEKNMDAKELLADALIEKYL